MDFDPRPLSIRKLLTDSDSFYQIPVYQRPYKWGKEEVDQLWTDIREAYENNQTSDEAHDYFLGAMVIAKPKGTGTYNDVVDGQQRLTTLVILCCVIRDLYPNINECSEEENAIKVRHIENALFEHGDSKHARLKFRTQDDAMTDFQAVIQKGGTCNLEQPKKKDLHGDNPKFKFHNAALVLQDCLRDIASKQGDAVIAKILNFLFDRVKVMRIDCDGVGAAIKIFQIINTRGLDLTPADLVKSHLLQILSDECGKDTEYRKKQENVFVSNWRTAETHVDQTDLKDMDALVALYQYYKNESRPKRGVYEDLQKLFDEQAELAKNLQKKEKKDFACVVAGELKEFSENYARRIHSVNDKIIYSLRYLHWPMLWKSVLLTALTVRYPDYDGLAHALRRFYYLYWIAGETLSKAQIVSFDVIKAVKGKKSLAEINRMLSEKITANIVHAAGRNLSADFIAKDAWCKPLLLMMEYAATDDSKMPLIEMDSKLHLEHVLPVKYGKNSGWAHICKDVADCYLNSGGNLTLLRGKKNEDASNKPFSEKIKIYRGEGKDKRETAFAITRSIIRDADSEKYQGRWNEEAMRDRKKWFLEQAAKILDIKIPAEKD